MFLFSHFGDDQFGEDETRFSRISTFQSWVLVYWRQHFKHCHYRLWRQLNLLLYIESNTVNAALMRLYRVAGSAMWYTDLPEAAGFLSTTMHLTGIIIHVVSNTVALETEFEVGHPYRRLHYSIW